MLLYLSWSFTNLSSLDRVQKCLYSLVGNYFQPYSPFLSDKSSQAYCSFHCKCSDELYSTSSNIHSSAQISHKYFKLKKFSKAQNYLTEHWLPNSIHRFYPEQQTLSVSGCCNFIFHQCMQMSWLKTKSFFFFLFVQAIFLVPRENLNINCPMSSECFCFVFHVLINFL